MGEIDQPKGFAQLGVPLHPAALDACFQILGATFSGEGDNKGFLPLSLDRFEILRAAPDRFRCHATIAAEPGSPVAVGRFTLSDLDGQAFARAEGLQIKQVTAPPPADAVRDMMLGVDWIAGDSPQPGWAGPQEIAAHVRQVAADLPSLAETGLSDGLDALAAAHARAALDALPDPTSVKPGRERLYRRLVSLAEHDSGMSVEKLLVAFPKNRSEIDLVDRCGRALPGALDGTSDALEALFADDRGEQSGLYSGQGLAARTNDLAAAALAAALKRRGNRTLSVMEIGAGTGATTQALLQQIPDDVTVDYLFTDISDGFLKAASQAFADRPEIRFARFDLEQDPAGQGLPDHGFDIVVAANVVHATGNITRSLANIRQVLAPGGLLMLAESTLRQDWWDIVFGLTDGWWRFDDTELRHDHALLDGQTWCDVLQKAGFREPVAVGVDTPGRQSIIMAQARSGNILAVHDGNDGRGSELAEALSDLWQARGGEALVMETDQALRHLNETGDTGAEWNVVYTGGVSAPHRRALQHAFGLSRAIANSGSGTLSFATFGLHSVAVNKESGRSTDGKAPMMEIGGATLAGFAKVLALEHGELGARVIDLDPASPSPAADLASAIAAPGPEREIAVRADGHHVARLAPQPLEQSELPVFDSDGAYLVTGAFGGLGPHLAAWLAEQGAGRLILTGRNSPATELAEDLKQLAPRIDIHVFDISEEDELSKVIAEAGTSLKGVFHLAGGVADGAIVSQEWDRFASILDAKADGALLLDRLTRSAPLDCFVLFSTSAALIGNPGQANHAAANAVLDALARRRRLEGLPGLSINWGAFSEAGAVVEKDQLETMAAHGVRPVPIEQGLDALGRAMTADVTNIGIVGVDWPAFLAGTEEAFPPFLERFRRQAKGPAQAAYAPQPAQSVDFAAQLAGVPESERRRKLAGLITEEAAHVLGIKDASRIDQDQALNELGLDSLLALELRNRLGAATGRKQLATLLFDHPSISALTEFFQEQVFAQVKEPPKPAGRNGQEDPDRIFAAEVETMSDAEIEALLDAEYAAATGS